jgi:prepilin-type processing-associated H-X9-DG protein
VIGPAGIGLFFDAVSYWHGSKGLFGNRSGERTNAAFLDGHAKNLSSTDYNALWSMSFR